MDQAKPKHPDKGTPLRRGWTTGACATAATKAALSALFDRKFPDPVQIRLPGGQTPCFALAHEFLGADFAEVGIIKDAGDDPDVTHGAMIISQVTRGKKGAGIVFHAGEGVGMVSKKGLPVEVGEPAINPVPRKMIREVVTQTCAEYAVAPDISVTISVPGGERIAQKTWNPRLGIIGGISILGTTGIVIPFSCSAWIHSIHSGIDVARAAGLDHIVGSTGKTSEEAVRTRLGLDAEAYIDMGDFVGGLLKYLRTRPVARLTIAGGFAKMSKLAQGALDLHSGRSEVDLAYLGALLKQLGADQKLVLFCAMANSAKQVLDMAMDEGFDLADLVAKNAAKIAQNTVKSSKVQVEVIVVDRAGRIVGNSEGGA
jgi:cobalt-precorrin-5B (C1)-methyltransferase